MAPSTEGHDGAVAADEDVTGTRVDRRRAAEVGCLHGPERARPAAPEEPALAVDVDGRDEDPPVVRLVMAEDGVAERGVQDEPPPVAERDRFYGAVGADAEEVGASRAVAEHALEEDVSVRSAGEARSLTE